MNAELFRELSVIAEDESLMAKMLKYAKKLTAAKKADSTLMTRKEFFAHVEKAERQISEGKGITFTNRDTMNDWLNSL